MKRHAALLSLSREHHDALKLARAAHQAAESGQPDVVDQLARQVVEAYERDLARHFDDEESIWLPVLKQAGALAMVQRTLLDHVELRALIDTLRSSAADLSALLRFSELMVAHVRFEERELFEALQLLGLCDEIGG